jgi:hypothetical protein
VLHAVEEKGRTAVVSDDTGMAINFQVGQLVTTYNNSWDEGRAADVSACFTPDGIFVDATGTAHQGRVAIEAFVEKSRTLFGSMRHLTTNHVVFEGPAGWVHRCYILFVWGIGLPEKTSATGHYDDEFVLEPDGPLFTIRRVYLDS